MNFSFTVVLPQTAARIGLLPLLVAVPIDLARASRANSGDGRWAAGMVNGAGPMRVCGRVIKGGMA